MALVLAGWIVLTHALAAQQPLPTLSATSSAPAAPAAPSAPAATPGPTAPPPVVTTPPDTQPVVRAAPGNWGMTFVFGGLAPLAVAGLGDQTIANGVVFTEIGVRRVFKRVVIPFSIGAGVSRQQTAGQTTRTTAAGLSASVAVLRGFRVWRRIAPYFGAFLHTHYVNPPGAGNWLVNVSIGPILGIEYFIADRVSLYGQGIAGIGPDITRNSVSIAARTAIAAGGQLGLTFYF